MPPTATLDGGGSGACASRIADACACQTAEACQARLAEWLRPAIAGCLKAQFDCGWVELVFDEAGCAQQLPARQQAQFAACLQRSLDERRWPCLGGTRPPLFLGSCTLM